MYVTILPNKYGHLHVWHGVQDLQHFNTQDMLNQDNRPADVRLTDPIDIGDFYQDVFPLEEQDHDYNTLKAGHGVVCLVDADYLAMFQD